VRLLIVDDNQRARTFVRTLFAGCTSAIEECGDGAQALHSYERFQPDFVLMDLQMEGMNGMLATIRIRALYPNARIVIVTNHDDRSLRDQAEAAGAIGYVLKQQMTDLPQMLRGLSSPHSSL
jgi:two-component system, NarL family, response regulator DegU